MAGLGRGHPGGAGQAAGRRRQLDSGGRQLQPTRAAGAADDAALAGRVPAAGAGLAAGAANRMSPPG